MKTELRSIVHTSLGDLAFRLLDASRNVARTTHSISVFSIQPTIPNGMSVRACTVILLSLAPRNTENGMIFSCSWELPFELRGGAESGQRLDAQSWVDGGTIVIVGTEDYEALDERLPHCGFVEDDYPVRYFPNGFEIVVPRAPAGEVISLHFVVAENPYPEPVEDSAWFAVDIDHARLMQNVTLNSN